jgi:hypothetical protein
VYHRKVKSLPKFHAASLRTLCRGRIGADRFARDFLFLLGDQRPTVRLAGVGHQPVKCVASAHLEQNVVPREVGQVGVVLVDQFEQRFVLLCRLRSFGHVVAFRKDVFSSA